MGFYCIISKWAFYYYCKHYIIVLLLLSLSQLQDIHVYVFAAHFVKTINIDKYLRVSTMFIKYWVVWKKIPYIRFQRKTFFSIKTMYNLFILIWILFKLHFFSEEEISQDVKNMIDQIVKELDESTGTPSAKEDDNGSPTL